ncbi:unnamed protein product [Strongylus vulgaris]|uniref:Uncharacterized protein n=1 Tax=Strongylus vulgaris TaxID=40348 RepID=A0A3P7IHB5_STRVU|nr:unnamed protein product [Strongylus vulgaris]
MFPLTIKLGVIDSLLDCTQETRGMEERGGREGGGRGEGEEEEEEEKEEATGWCQYSGAHCRVPLPLGPTLRMIYDVTLRLGSCTPTSPSLQELVLERMI